MTARFSTTRDARGLSATAELFGFFPFSLLLVRRKSQICDACQGRSVIGRSVVRHITKTKPDISIVTVEHYIQGGPKNGLLMRSDDLQQLTIERRVM